MLYYFLLAATLTLTLASPEANWIIFKQKHNKVYNAEEDVLRKYVWMNHLKRIEAHNELYAQGKVSFYMGENEYSDMTIDEIRTKMNGYQVKPHPKRNSLHFEPSAHKMAPLPDFVDWRQKGYVTPVQNQGPCGSCWAFSATGSIEGQHFNATGKLVKLSESNLVDCSSDWGNQGCHSGSVDNAFQYVIDNGGIDTEASYPYDPMPGSCYYTDSGLGATMRSFTDIKRGSEEDLQRAVAEVGPVSVGIDASQNSFLLYQGGIYDEPQCSSEDIDHAVLVVGYGSKGGQDFWIVKNSWGETWGEKGYILMSRNKNNQCAIATMALYPVV